MTDQTLLLFPDLVKKELGNARFAKYLWLVKTAEEARRGLRVENIAQANQYDKAEELITWNTFASLMKMNRPFRDETIVQIIEYALDKSIKEYIDDKDFSIWFERVYPSPPTYLQRLRTSVNDHPVRYVRDSAKGKKILEGETHVDLTLENSKLLTLVEVKFTSDISSQVRYDPVRNQLARLIDVGLHASGDKKLAVLLASPSWAYRSKSRLYYYKINDYRTSAENIRTDLPHRSLGEIEKTLLEVGWLPLEYAATTIHRRAIDLGLVSKGEVGKFYEERRIPLSI